MRRACYRARAERGIAALRDRIRLPGGQASAVAIHRASGCRAPARARRLRVRSQRAVGDNLQIRILSEHGVIAGAVNSTSEDMEEGGCFPINEGTGSRLQRGPYIGRRTAMGEYIGLDVSLKETAVSIRRGDKRVWRGSACRTRGHCSSDPRTPPCVGSKGAGSPTTGFLRLASFIRGRTSASPSTTQGEGRMWERITVA
jgi:hypothetical protein